MTGVQTCALPISSLSRPIRRRLSPTNSAALALFSLALLGYLSLRKLAPVKAQLAAEGALKSLGNSLLSVNTRRANELAKGPDASLPPTPAGAAPRESDSGEGEDETPATSPQPSLPASPVQNRARSSSSVALLGISPLFDTKELPPIPPPDFDDDVDSDGDGEAKGGDETPRKKNRRRRGKRPNKKAAAAAAAGESPSITTMKGVVLFPDESMDKELGGITLAESDLKDDAEFEDSTLVPPADPHVIGGLIVSETILGAFLPSCGLEAGPDD